MINKIEDNSWFWKKEWNMTGERYTEAFKSISNVPVQQNHVGNLVKTKQNQKNLSSMLLLGAWPLCSLN